jgi:hypothetical protein
MAPARWETGTPTARRRVEFLSRPANRRSSTRPKNQNVRRRHEHDIDQQARDRRAIMGRKIRAAAGVIDQERSG